MKQLGILIGPSLLESDQNARCCVAEQVIKGTWEQVAQQYDLRGRRVRITLLDDGGPAAATDNPWVRQLREWAGSHTPVTEFADDSRESIYGGTVDDPR
jgi:hypothetical protein